MWCAVECNEPFPCVISELPEQMVIWMEPVLFGFQIRLSIWFPGSLDHGKQYAKTILSYPNMKSLSFVLAQHLLHAITIISVFFFLLSFFFFFFSWSASAFVMLQVCCLWEAYAFWLPDVSRKKKTLLALQQAFPGSREKTSLTWFTWLRVAWRYEVDIFDVQSLKCFTLTVSFYLSCITDVFFFSLSLFVLSLPSPHSHTYTPEEIAYLRKTLPDTAKWLRLPSIFKWNIISSSGWDAPTILPALISLNASSPLFSLFVTACGSCLVVARWSNHSWKESQKSHIREALESEGLLVRQNSEYHSEVLISYRNWEYSASLCPTSNTAMESVYLTLPLSD